MASKPLVLPNRFTRQPQQPVPVDRIDRFGKAAEVVFSFGGGGAERISGRTASTNTSTQVVNGRGRAAQFNGAQQFLFDKTEAYSGPYLIAAITQADTAAGGVGNVASGSNIAAGYSWQLRSNGSTWEFYHLDGSSSNVLAAESGGVIAGQPTVLVGLWDGANIKFLRDGALRATTAVATQVRAVDRISLGYDGASAGQFYTGSINEAVLFRGVFSTADAIELSQNLYRIFQAPARRIWVAASAGTNTAVNPGVGTIALTGYAPTVAQSANQSVTPGAGSITITGYAPTIAQPQAVSPGAGSLAITGYAPTVTQAAASQNILPGVGSLTITGYAPSVVQSSPSTKVGGDDVPTRGKRERIEIWDLRKKKQPDPVEIEIEEVVEPIAEIEPQPIIRQPLTAEERAQAQKLASALIYKPVPLKTVPGIIAQKIQLAPYFAPVDEDEEEALLMLL